MTVPTAVVSEQEWNSEREALLVKENELTRARDALAAERRRLPDRVEKDYRFEGPEGEVGFLDLFDGRRQLIVYRFFLDPGMKIASYPEGCPGCSMFADNLPNLTHLNARDTTLVFVSAGSQDVIRAYRTRMGWDVPWYTTADDFWADFGVPEYWGVNVFLRDERQIYRSYFTAGRAGEELSSVWALLDITPSGLPSAGHAPRRHAALRRRWRPEEEHCLGVPAAA